MTVKHKGRNVGLIAILYSIVLTYGIIPTAVHAESHPSEVCNQTAAHSSLLFLLIDRSDSARDTGAFEQSMTALGHMIKPGERLVAGVITDRVSNTRLLIDIVRPEPSVWESVLKQRQQEKAFFDCLKKLEGELLAKEEAHKSSAILETLGYVQQVLSSDATANKRVVLFSDMAQNSDSLSFYKRNEITVAPLLAQAKKVGLQKEFKGVDVFIAGTTGGGLSDKINRGIEDFWREYFKIAAANLKFYGTVLVPPQ